MTTAPPTASKLRQKRRRWAASTLRSAWAVMVWENCMTLSFSCSPCETGKAGDTSSSAVKLPKKSSSLAEETPLPIPFEIGRRREGGEEEREELEGHPP